MYRPLLLVVALVLNAARAAGPASAHNRLAAVLKSLDTTEEVHTVSFLGSRGSRGARLVRGLFGDAPGPGVSFISDARVALADFGTDIEAAGDNNVAVAVADAVVCNIAYEDVLRGTIDLSTLQATVENLLALYAEGTLEQGSQKKRVFVTCSDCVDEQADEVKALVQAELASMWSNLLKPVDYDTAALSEFLQVDVRVIPHYRTAGCAAQLAGLKDDILSAASSASDVSVLLDAIGPKSARSQARCSAQTDDMESVFGCTAAVDTVYQTFADELEATLAAALDECDVSEFGSSCDAALEVALANYDVEAGEYAGSRAQKAKKEELVTKIHMALSPLFAKKLTQLADDATTRMKKSLRKLSLTDASLLNDMESAVRDADAYFKTSAASMACRGAPWSANLERRRCVAAMRHFVRERLQVLRLGGKYVEGMGGRKPVAVSLNWLIPSPMRLYDAVQDSLRFDENMEYEYEEDIDDDGVVRSPSGIRDETNLYAARVSRSADQDAE